jgi:hypothetical protein
MDNENIPPAHWTSIAQGCVVFLSAIWLIQQRIKSIRLDNDSIIHTKEYTKRDVTDPFSNGSRPSRILFGTAAISMTCIYILVSNTVETGNPTRVYIAHLVSLVYHLYGFVLGVTAYRFPFPSNWGWALNMQLFFIYSVSLTTSAINLITILWENPTIPARMVCPYILILALSLDISFTTAATKKGQSFLDEKDKKVNGFSESSILGHLYFNWMTPIIDLANRNGARLANDDLPTLPSTLRAFNLYYLFKFYRDRKSSLFYKIYRTNRKYFLIQTTLSILGASLFFVSPYCLNNLLLLIESYTQGDNRIILKGFGYVCVMGLNTVIISLVKSQLWFYGNSTFNAKIYMSIF